MSGIQIAKYVAVVCQAWCLQGVLSMMGFGAGEVGMGKNLGLFMVLLLAFLLNRVITDIEHGEIR